MRAAAKAEAAKAKAGAQGGEELLLQEEIRPPPEEPTAGQGKDVPHWVSIPSSSLSLPWYAPRTYTTLASARAAGVWTYPTTPKEKAKCAVFSSLHARGHYLGPGLKFGGDWLVYPGDPLRYHSHFVATAFAGLAAGLRPMDVVAFGRLGTATKKAHLLCAWEEGTGEVTYFSIEWANFG
ncbi:tRNA-intron endonuclease catalytic domain-like protein [Calocera viscosa TUFC12733]|uniref:tRNA-intron lyase n=1 Tax=Calocera viscosa (strain TUFC12733) TaxID=1330018 RepID=A0A167LI11_CALVF|nr:tRNA-intron endonuclease catalytic domain-like protein [Calocera viscosa TUFC12733]